MRLSLLKGARAVLFSAAWQEIRVRGWTLKLQFSGRLFTPLSAIKVLRLESSKEHPLTDITGVLSATLGTGSSTTRQKPFVIRQICAALRSG